MTVRILIALAGSSFTFAVGDITEASEANAERLIAAGYAEPVAVPDEVETAAITDAAPEQAVVTTTTKSRTTKTK
jgi:hypothetical protein